MLNIIIFNKNKKKKRIENAFRGGNVFGKAGNHLGLGIGSVIVLPERLNMYEYLGWKTRNQGFGARI